MKVDERRKRAYRLLMTPAQIEREYKLPSGAVRQAITRSGLPAFDPDDRTYFVWVEDVERKWGKRPSSEPEQGDDDGNL